MAIKLENRAEIEKKFSSIYDKHDGPILICSNHLTLIDSIMVQYYLGSYLKYLKDFDKFIWSFPERENFAGNIFLNVITYFGKCIHVRRSKGNLKKQNLIEKITYLKKNKQVLSLFPEGTRSRSGRIIPSETSYGAGEMLEYLPQAKVLCLYLRGQNQQTYSHFPQRGEKVNALLEEISPSSELTGRKKQKDLSLQIISHLKSMEEKYFAHRS